MPFWNLLHNVILKLMHCWLSHPAAHLNLRIESIGDSEHTKANNG
ncbi:18252_t:CDS:2, partial [Funneliformis geosporum]